MTSQRLTEAEARRRFIADAGVLEALGVAPADLGDPDARALAIRAEHPELERALREGREESGGQGEPMNPRLHLAMHEVVATQLWDDDPPEAWLTARRLVDAGYERHEVLHMLASTMAEQIWSATTQARTYDRERHVASLRALPGSWDGERGRRAGEAAERRHRDDKRKARRAAREARRRSRRR